MSLATIVNRHPAGAVAALDLEVPGGHVPGRRTQDAVAPSQRPAGEGWAAAREISARNCLAQGDIVPPRHIGVEPAHVSLHG